MSASRSGVGRRHVNSPEGKRKKRSTLLKILRRILMVFLILILLGSATVFYAFKIEPGRLLVRRVSLEFSNLPAQWDGRKVVFFTDVHSGPGFSPERLEKAVAAIRKESPDLVLFGGDLVDSETPEDDAYKQRIGSILATIEAPLGKLAIAGNHDNRLRAELLLARNMLEKGGFSFLINQAKNIDGLTVGGLDESYFGKPDFQTTFKSVPENQFRIVLMHQPDYMPSRPELIGDLILSGHSHNGQITFFGIPIVKVYDGRDYTYGLYRLDEKRQLFVSGGLGTVGIHARLFAPPEIVVLTLYRKVS